MNRVEYYVRNWANKRVLGMRFTVVIYLQYDSAQHKVFGVSCHAFAGNTHFSAPTSGFWMREYLPVKRKKRFSA